MHPSVYAENLAAKPAFIMGATGETVSYAQLEARSNKGAHLFRSMGLSRGDGLAVMLDNNRFFLEVIWAAQRAGLYYTCISTRLVPAEIAFILEDSGAKALVTAGAIVPDIAEAARDLGIAILTVGGGGGVQDFETARSGFPETPIADQSPGNDMLYSSGTTGRPKGIRPPLPEGPLGETNPLTELGRTVYGMDSDTVFLSPAPLYHAAPLRWCMSVQKLGGTVIIMEKFDAEEALALIAHHRVTHAQWVPTHFIRMLKLDSEVRARYDVSSLKTVFHAAAPCPVPVKQAMMEWWGPIIHEFYGGTEANVICPPLSGPETMIVWTTKGTMNAEQEAQAGRDYRQAA